MDSKPASQLFVTEEYGYQQLYILQNKNILSQKMYSAAEPILTEVQPMNDTLKTFYENSINLVGQLNQTASIDGQQYVMVQQSPNVNIQEYLINPENAKLNNFISTPENLAESDSTNKPSIKKRRKLLPKQRVNNTHSHTSVHVLKVGDKYHTVSKLTDEQKRMVNQTLQNIEYPVKGPLKPIYDAVSKTQITYKVVSPEDLKVVGRNKVVISDEYPQKSSKKTETKIKPGKPVENGIEKKPHETKKMTKKTRSGRVVKVPNHDSTETDKMFQRQRKKFITAMSCMHCSSEFNSIYKLQRHYQVHPSHIPSTSHTNLYHCLVTIVNSGKQEDKTDTFLQQLEGFIGSLKAILPCLLKKFEGIEGTFCRISEDVGRLFGMCPGKYNLNIDALNCVKENDGSCKHNPPKQNQFTSDMSKPSQVWLSKHIEETALENEAEICARTNSIEKWPPFTKRTWKYKQSLMNKNKNCQKTVTETEDIHLVDDGKENTQDESHNSNVFSTQNQQDLSSNQTITRDVSEKPHLQFQSSHFDIRTSPIKNQPSGIFNQFQINLNRLSKFEGQFLSPSTFTESIEPTNTENSLDGMLRELNSKTNISNNPLDIIDRLNCKNTDSVSSDVCFNRSKDWIGASVDSDQSHESYQANVCIEPTMIHIRDNHKKEDQVHNHTNEIQSVLNVSDSCLTLPPEPLTDCLGFNDSELRNSSMDLPLDLFSFNNP